MGHDGDVPPAHFLHISQQLNERIGVRIGGKALRPERQRSRANAQVLNMRQVVGVLEGLEVLLEPA